MVDFMSSLKPAWHIHRIDALRRGQNIVPTHLQLIISDLCNQNCHFCAYRMDGGFSTENFWEDGNRNPKRFIPELKCYEILDDYERLGGRSVEFTGGGEPTVHPKCIQIIEYAQKLGLKTGLVTNGVRLQDSHVYHNLDWLRISLDAGTEETYRKIRESTAWPKVINNLELAGRLEKPMVGVGFVVTRENYTEIMQACRIVKDAKIPYIRVSAMFSMDGSDYYAEIPDKDLPYNLPETWDDLQIVNLFNDRISDLDQGAPDYEFCGYQQFVLYIGGDQKVYTCCTNAYTTHGELADLRETKFGDFLLEYNRRQWDSRRCHHCQFNSKNRLINYLLDPGPDHVDFV